MAQELIYTSAPSGLRGGSGGFCTVAYTDKMHLELIQLLESLSAYKAAFSVHDIHAVDNPIAYTHFIYTIKLQNYSILSRVAPTLADHTLRDNKLAHHIVLSRRELVPAGPGGLVSDPNFFCSFWNEEPHYLPEREILNIEEGGLFASTWQKFAEDAGWAGVLAKHSIDRPRVPAFVIYKPQTPVHLLFKEALALMPENQRWKITFSTYFFFQPAGSSCLWRGCLEGSSAAKEARRQPQSLIIDLTQPLPVLSQKSQYIDCARGNCTEIIEKTNSKNPANRTQRLPYQGQILSQEVNKNGHISPITGIFGDGRENYKIIQKNNHSEESPKTVQSFLNRWKDN